jgi:hypothetical protein
MNQVVPKDAVKPEPSLDKESERLQLRATGGQSSSRALTSKAESLSIMQSDKAYSGKDSESEMGSTGKPKSTFQQAKEFLHQPGRVKVSQNLGSTKNESRLEEPTANQETKYGMTSKDGQIQAPKKSPKQLAKAKIDDKDAAMQNLDNTDTKKIQKRKLPPISLSKK